MNIFKELILSLYDFKSFKEFIKNKRSKVFFAGVVLMVIYFSLTMNISEIIYYGSSRKVKIPNMQKQIFGTAFLLLQTGGSQRFRESIRDCFTILM